MQLVADRPSPSQERWRFEARGYGRSLTYHPHEGNYDEWAFLLHRVEPGTERGEIRHLLNDEDIAFVLAHGRCFYCRRGFIAPLRECPCGKAFWDGCEGVIHASHLRSAGRLAERIFKRQKSRDGNRRRAEQLRAAEGKRVTPAEKAALFRAQEGLCYYCGGRMVQTGSGKYHHDHFVPLARGGRVDLENAVLACGACNVRKSAQTGVEFLTRMRRHSDFKASPQLVSMRRSLARWRRDLGFRAFAALPVA